MKTRGDITGAITAKREEERKECVEWAISIIDKASEEMFEKLQTAIKIDVDCSNSLKWDRALKEPEVEECLAKNGFEAYTCDLMYFIKIA